MSDLINREIVLMFLREWTYCSDVEDLVLTLNAEPVQTQIDAAREAALREVAFMAENGTLPLIGVQCRDAILAMSRKGDQP